MENGAIGDLSIENDRLTIRGFDKRYEDWLSQSKLPLKKGKKQEEYEKGLGRDVRVKEGTGQENTTS